MHFPLLFQAGSRHIGLRKVEAVDEMLEDQLFNAS